jgi:hypothetical protein
MPGEAVIASSFSLGGAVRANVKSELEKTCEQAL